MKCIYCTLYSDLLPKNSGIVGQWLCKWVGSECLSVLALSGHLLFEVWGQHIHVWETFGMKSVVFIVV